MKSFIDLDRTLADQPASSLAPSWRASTPPGDARSSARISSELLKRLSENARIASITASNAIEGVIVSSERALKIAEGAPRFRNRNEQEFAGYRDAIDSLIRVDRYERPTVPFLLHLHRLLFEYAGGRGGYLKTDENFIVSYESGSREVVFTPPGPAETPFLLSELLARYNDAQAADAGHPLILIAALILDLLAIHPVADGNGRLARLLTTHELLSRGYGVARYVSIEQRIYESKNSYYKALYDSQQGWHEAEHTIWPWTSYLAAVMAGAYEDFEGRVARERDSAGSKQARVRRYILEQAPPEFRRREIERALPGVSSATVRLVLQRAARQRPDPTER